MYNWPYYMGKRLLSDNEERFELAREYASLAAEISDFRFYFNELKGSELQTLMSKWLYTRKGNDGVIVVIVGIVCVDAMSQAAETARGTCGSIVMTAMS